MIGKRKVVAIIPARGGSKGIPKKNIVQLAGKPLIEHTIISAMASKSVDIILVTTDSAEIKIVSERVLNGWPKEHIIIDRPAALATDTTTIAPVMQHALKEMEMRHAIGTYVAVLLQPTSPLRTSNDIDSTVAEMIDPSVESAETFSEEHPVGSYYLIVDGVPSPISPENLEKRRQDQPILYRENGAVYCCRNDVIDRGTLYGKYHRAVIMPANRSIDIDSMEDVLRAEFLLNPTAEVKKQMKCKLRRKRKL